MYASLSRTYFGFLLALLLSCLSVRTAAQTSFRSVGEPIPSQTIPLGTVIDQIALKHQVTILYDAAQTEHVYVKTFSPSTSVERDLKAVLKGSVFTYTKINAQTYAIKQVSAPAPNTESGSPAGGIYLMDVSGKVVDRDSGEPLIGATVVVVKSQRGVLTGSDGGFSIQAELGEQLIVKYLGYEDLTVKIERANLGTLGMLPSQTNLQEVVVVGYGTQKKSDLTGAVSSISQEDLEELPNTGLDQAIQGRAPGVYVTQNSGAPGGGVSIRIRGIGSTLTAEPLYVIDGIPVVNDNQGSSSNFSELDGGGQHTNALNTINPNDIESIEILKDASATAIYGARAANGVVLITTKRGKEGKSNMSFDSYLSMQQLARKIPVMDLQQYAEYYGDVGYETIEEFERPELLGAGTDWQDEVFRQAFTQNYQLTFAGGERRTQHAFSVGYHEKEGTVVGSDFNRLSAKINLDHDFSDRLKIGNSFLFSRTHENITFNDNSGGVIYTALLMVPNAPVRNADGSFAGPQEEITLSFDNPVARALETQDRNVKTRLLGNVYMELKLFPSLTYRTEFGADLNYANHTTFFPSFQRGNQFGKSGIRKSLNSSVFWINKHLLTFDKTFNEKHHLTVMGGFEAQAGQYEWLFASRDNLPSNELPQLTLGDAGQQTNDGGAGHWALLSYFGRLNYNFDDRYLLTSTLRVDGSSRFGPNNRYGWFPSAAVAWKVSNEAFFQNWDAWKALKGDLKIRAGVGVVGNQEIGLYSYSANIRSVNVVMGDQLRSGYIHDNLANPNVRWESSFQANLGLNLSLLNSRITFTMDVYDKRADGMLLPALLPATAGSLNPPFVNVGEIQNRGIELALISVNIQKPLTWKTTANVSFNRNEVVSLGSSGNLTGIIQRIPVTRTEEGQPIGQFYGHVMEGIFQSQAEVGESPFQADGTRAGDIKFADLNEDGIIDDKDQTFLGSPHPDFTANLINDFSLKGFDLSIFLQGVYGNEILNLIRRDLEGMAGLTNQSVVVADRFSSMEPSTEVPRANSNDPNNNRRVSDRFIEDGSFLRLKNLTLGYTFNRTRLEAFKLEYLRLYAGAQNIWTLTSYTGYDPDIGSYNQNPLINGVENGRYPIAKSFTFGLSAKF
ncbi:TonB-dependent receptor [Pontibacter sp. G13]|uniref:SusC/RagA family TonB-linked outer membrane protein n=1 Tax=Pontibacter sp. G13 TaxID=3074898 RepID=UPI00288A069F|nr:TonB-dependent receptor [Pontibacter sp. G13]WNJ19695.1 TonB-dependent receptor [Pontibacter sp. G13]